MCDLCLVFFFFKQQRACEMLISDWRSGVCSSELLGRLTAANQTSGANDLTFTYDALGRNLTQAGPLGTMTSTYDAAGRRTELQWPDAFYVNHDHLVTGEVTKVRENGATSGVGVLATYAYDDLGRRTGITRGNGVAASYAWHPVDRKSTRLNSSH